MVVILFFWTDIISALPFEVRKVSDAWRLPVVAIITVLTVVIGEVFGSARRGGLRRAAGGGRPKEGEFWMAFVPFSDGTIGKDRPCLLLNIRGTMGEVLYVTSQDKSQDSCYVQIDNDRWAGRIRGRQSWMRVAQRNGSSPTMQVPLGNFRRRLGRIATHDSLVLERHGINIR